MKLPLSISIGKVYHQYCLSCWHETVERVINEGKTLYHCQNCDATKERSLVIDPAIKSWVDDNRLYWHESAGVFVRNPKNQILLFKRTIFPFSMTVPSGHVDQGEEPLEAARRELGEETSLATKGLKLREFAQQPIHGDSCRRGCDDHIWHAFVADVPDQPVAITEEGLDPVWLSINKALEQDLTVPVRYMLERFAYELTG